MASVTIEELREQLATANEQNATLTEQLKTATTNLAESQKRIDELVTYNNKLFTRLSFEQTETENKESAQETEDDVVKDIVEKMKKRGK